MTDYLNLELMDKYLTTLHDIVKPKCQCKESIQACIELRKSRQEQKNEIAHETKKKYDRIRIRKIRRANKK